MRLSLKYNKPEGESPLVEWVAQTANQLPTIHYFLLSRMRAANPINNLVALASSLSPYLMALNEYHLVFSDSLVGIQPKLVNLFDTIPSTTQVRVLMNDALWNKFINKQFNLIVSGTLTKAQKQGVNPFWANPTNHKLTL